MHTGTFMKPKVEEETLTLSVVAKRLRDRLLNGRTKEATVTEEEYLVIEDAAQGLLRAKGYMEISESPFFNGMRELNRLVTGKEQ
jgi:Flp pilus assembly protein TadD